MTREEILNIIKWNKQELFDKYSISELALFGSYSRGDYTFASDIDLLAEFNRPIGIEFIDLADELEVMLNKKVDLVSRGGIKTRYLAHIEKDLIYV